MKPRKICSHRPGQWMVMPEQSPGRRAVQSCTLKPPRGELAVCRKVAARRHGEMSACRHVARENPSRANTPRVQHALLEFQDVRVLHCTNCSRAPVVKRDFLMWILTVSRNLLPSKYALVAEMSKHRLNDVPLDASRKYNRTLRSDAYSSIVSAQKVYFSF